MRFRLTQQISQETKHFRVKLGVYVKNGNVIPLHVEKRSAGSTQKSLFTLSSRTPISTPGPLLWCVLLYHWYHKSLTSIIIAEGRRYSHSGEASISCPVPFCSCRRKGATISAPPASTSCSKLSWILFIACLQYQYP